MSIKHANPDHPIQPMLAERWSPYVFSDRPVPNEDLRSLFEALRWSASSYNEQPWRYVVATKDDPEEYERLLSCLVEPNQAWAQHAPVLVLAIARTRFERNDKPNSAAQHDLGLAAGNLLTEASARRIDVHQMIGILPDRARELYDIPEDSTPLTALAIGYAGDPEAADPRFAERDRAARSRRPLRELVFSKRFGETASWVDGD